MSGVQQDLNRKYMQDLTADMKLQADEMQTTIDTMNQMISLMEQMSATTHSIVGRTRDMTVDIAEHDAVHAVHSGGSAGSAGCRGEPVGDGRSVQP